MEIAERKCLDEVQVWQGWLPNNPSAVHPEEEVAFKAKLHINLLSQPSISELHLLAAGTTLVQNFSTYQINPIIACSTKVS